MDFRPETVDTSFLSADDADGAQMGKRHGAWSAECRKCPPKADPPLVERVRNDEWEAKGEKGETGNTKHAGRFYTLVW